MTVARTQESATGSSQEMVATQTKSLLEQQNHSEIVLTSGTGSQFLDTVIETVTGRTLSTQLGSSLMPRRTKLNEEITKYHLTGLQQSADDAMAVKKKTRKPADKPTADLVRRGSFKVGSKLLITVSPSRTLTPMDDQIPNLVFDKFSLQGIAEPDEERYQLHETFESEVLFLFGRRPRVWTLQGIVLNGRRAPEFTDPNDTGVEDDEEKAERLADTHDFANSLVQDWEDYYRGSKAIEAKAKTYISYEDTIIEGTLLSLTVVRNAQIPSAANATLTFVVHQRSFLGQEDRDGVTAPNLADLASKALLDTPRVEPSDIGKAKATNDEVERQEAESEQEVVKNRATLEEVTKERDDLLRTIEEQVKRKDTADKVIAANQQAQADWAAAAQAPGATTAEIEEATRNLTEVTNNIVTQNAVKADADAKIGEANSRLTKVAAEYSSASTALSDSEAKNDALSASSDKAVPPGGAVAS